MLVMSVCGLVKDYLKIVSFIAVSLVLTCVENEKRNNVDDHYLKSSESKHKPKVRIRKIKAFIIRIVCIKTTTTYDVITFDIVISNTRSPTKNN